MRIPRASSSCIGITLVELLVVIAVIVLLFALTDPLAEPRAKQKAIQAQCINNQRQMGIALIMWQGDNGGKFPWQLSTATNGTMELIDGGSVVPQFQELSNYFRQVGVYHCPADTARFTAADYKTLTDSNISYFVNVDAGSKLTVMTGDRNLQANGRPVQPGSFLFTNGMTMDWTQGLHSQSSGKTRGVVSFTDGHVEVIAGTNLAAAFTRQGTNDERLLVP